MTMPTQDLQCPFCDITSARGTGLTAHIRGRHPNKYAKWVKDPNRLEAARMAAATKETAGKPSEAKSAAAPKQTAAKADSAAVKSTPVQPTATGNAALELLRTAQAHLGTRKESIEAEIARFDDLKKELEAVNTQIEALEKTLGAF
jgi:hypothetical protein